MEYPTNGQREHGGNVNLHSSLQTASDPMKDCYSNDIESPEMFSLRLRFICDRLYYKYKVLKRLFNTISKIIFNNTYFYSYMFLLPNERDHVTTPTKYRYKGFDVTYQVVIKKDGNIFNITINATL
ncbi:unnamed protein product [Acanthoscelides obtectus]|uniref:Uncharacterized protein n=1 Tax=Acanthoscelides obtectus TaxID=200917 RepID=A0A9P0L2U4_ACAOB|nr:unnamed protein product [Acanthoscelides obtectus]CAK1649734.1 hypothetical protein AOBTE_LOCUS16389 [Acanthoscelides obtectus]